MNAAMLTVKRSLRDKGRSSSAVDSGGQSGHNDHMSRDVVGARELKTRLGTYLQRVREGRTLIVTDRGEPIAELRPLANDSSIPSALVRLSTKGSISLPSRASLSPFRPIRNRGESLSKKVLEDREDRF